MPPSRLIGIQPGDVLAVRTPSRIFGSIIRFGEALAGRPHRDDHVVIAHHSDDAGTQWGIEGRPGGVGWVDIATYDNRWLLNNAVQYKTPSQRQQVCDAAVALLGAPYDWAAIGMDALTALGFQRLWPSRDFGDRPPGHVVCSSFAAWLYRHVGLAEPSTRERWTTPGDWAQFMIDEGWLAPA